MTMFSILIQPGIDVRGSESYRNRFYNFVVCSVLVDVQNLENACSYAPKKDSFAGKLLRQLRPLKPTRYIPHSNGLRQRAHSVYEGREKNNMLEYYGMPSAVQTDIGHSDGFPTQRRRANSMP